VWPVSQRYLDTRATSHTQVTKVEILHDGAVATVLVGEPAVDPVTGAVVQSVGGRVDVSRQAIRRSGTIDLLDVSGLLVPDEVGDLLVPMTSEVRPYTGVVYADAAGGELAASAADPGASGAGYAREYVPLGTLGVVDVAGEYPRVSISGYDRMWYLSRFTSAYTVAAGTNVGTALAALLYAQIPAGHLTLDLPSTEHTTGAVVFDEQTESVDAAHALAAAVGWVLYADPLGRVVARDEPSTDDPPVMTYEPGAASVLMRPSHTVSAAEAVNVSVTSGDAADLATPVRGYWEDSDPRSLTYVGRVGRRPQFHSSSLYRTTAQADLGARTLGLRNSGLADNYVIPVVPNHALESGDVIQVRDPDQAIDLPLLADAFGVSMRVGDGAQTINCRARVLR